MKYDSVILEREELHSSKLKENNSVHVLGFAFPVNFEHWAQRFVLWRINFQLIVDAIPSLYEAWANVLFCFFVVVLELKNFFAETIRIIAFIKLTTDASFFRLLFLVFGAFFDCSFDLNIIFVEGIIFKVFLLILGVTKVQIFPLMSSPHWSQNYKFVQINDIWCNRNTIISISSKSFPTNKEFKEHKN